MQKINVLFFAFVLFFFTHARSQNGFSHLEEEFLEVNRLFEIVDSNYIFPLSFSSSKWHGRVINTYKQDMKKFKENISFPLNDGDPCHEFQCPHNGRLTSYFGPRWGSFHYGTDIKLNVGDTVFSAMQGVVRIVTYEPGYGNFVVITHEGGLETLYGHLSDFLVKQEDTVSAGQPIALGGSTGFSTGPHLHFEIRFMGAPINPETVFDFYKKQLKTNQLAVGPRSFDYLALKNPYAHVRHVSSASNVGGSGTLYHTIKYGDCLYNLSIKYGTSVTKICALNGITPKTVLLPGKTIRVR